MTFIEPLFEHFLIKTKSNFLKSTDKWSKTRQIIFVIQAMQEDMQIHRKIFLAMYRLGWILFDLIEITKWESQYEVPIY